MWKHPNYYKNLRKLARLRNRDQAISLQAETSDAGRTPGTGQQADKPSSSGLSMRGDRGKPTAASLGPELEFTSSQAGGRVGPKDSS